MTWCRRGLALAARLLARHWGLAVLLGCGAILRAAVMLAYWPALIYIDTPRYLQNYLPGVDPLGYHYLLLQPLLFLHAGLPGIAVTQHLLGLAMGAALYALAVRHGAPRWLAALAAVPVLLDAYQLQAEQMIMPDVFFEALICSALLLLAWPRAALPPDRGDASDSGVSPGSARIRMAQRVGVRVAGAALLLGVAATVRQVGELALIPLLGYALLARPAAGTRRVITARARAALIGVAVFAVPVGGYVTLSGTVLRSGFRLSEMNDVQLYARLSHAADCAALRVPAYDRPVCSGVPGPGIDDLVNSPQSPAWAYSPPAGVTSATVVSTFEHAVLTQQPLHVAGDITRDAVKLFALTRDTSAGDPPIDRWQFQTAYPVFQPAYRMVFGTGPAGPRTDPAVAAALRWYQLHGGYTPGPLFLAFGLVAAFGALSPRSPRSLRAGAAIAAGLGLAIVGGADLYEFSWRYQLPALITLPPAGVLGALAAARSRPGAATDGARESPADHSWSAGPGQRV